MIISYGWTVSYLPPNGPKDTTRRKWSDRTFNGWCSAWDKGILTHAATDTNLAYGGKYIGIIRLIERPFRQHLRDMPESDVIREGGMVGTVKEFICKYFDGNADQVVAVVRFDFTDIEHIAYMCEWGECRDDWQRLIRDYVKAMQESDKAEKQRIDQLPICSLTF